MYGEAACVSSMCGRELSHEITTCHWQLAKAQLSNRVIPRWPKDDDSEGGFILRRIYNRRDNEREVLSFFFFITLCFAVAVRRMNGRTRASREENQYSRVCETRAGSSFGAQLTAIDRKIAPRKRILHALSASRKFLSKTSDRADYIDADD